MTVCEELSLTIAGVYFSGSDWLNDFYSFAIFSISPFPSGRGWLCPPDRYSSSRGRWFPHAFPSIEFRSGGAPYHWIPSSSGFLHLSSVAPHGVDRWWPYTLQFGHWECNFGFLIIGWAIFPWVVAICFGRGRIRIIWVVTEWRANGLREDYNDDCGRMISVSPSRRSDRDNDIWVAGSYELYQLSLYQTQD